MRAESGLVLLVLTVTACRPAETGESRPSEVAAEGQEAVAGAGATPIRSPGASPSGPVVEEAEDRSSRAQEPGRAARARDGGAAEEPDSPPTAAPRKGDDRPLLSEAIRSALESGGPAAAKARFDGIVPSRVDEYELDPRALLELGTDHATRGDWVSAQVLFEMGQEAQLAVSDGQGRKALGDIEAMLAEAEAADADRAAASDTGDAGRRGDWGQPREDLARFHGLYGDPGDRGPSARRLVVSETCERLQVAATWGDAAPIVLRSVSDAVFAEALPQPDFYDPVEVEFRTAEDGSVEAMVHNLAFIESPLRRVADLPQGWGSSCEPR